MNSRFPDFYQFERFRVSSSALYQYFGSENHSNGSACIKEIWGIIVNQLANKQHRPLQIYLSHGVHR